MYHQEILECPFCGLEPQVMVTKLAGCEDGKEFWIKCDECGIEQSGLYSYAEALRRWNRRAK